MFIDKKSNYIYIIGLICYFMKRKAKILRKTKETSISVEANIDGKGKYNIKTGIGFLDHMLEQLSKHGLFDLNIKASGDTEIDFHHTVEDVGIALGEAFNEALGDKKSIKRYGSFSVPFDETLSSSDIDLSGRPFFIFDVDLNNGKHEQTMYFCDLSHDYVRINSEYTT